MPDDLVSAIELTPAQAQFISRYLQKIPDGVLTKKKKRVNAFNVNETVKAEFLRFDKARTEVLEDLRQAEQTIEAAKTRQEVYDDKSGQPDQVFAGEILKLTGRRQTIRSNIMKIIGEAENADDDKPVFGKAADDLDAIKIQIEALVDDVPDAKPMPTPATAKIDACLREVANLRIFADVKEFTLAATQNTLPDQATDQKRITELQTHADLCDEADKTLRGFLKDKKRLERNSEKASGVLSKLKSDRQPVIRNLARHINSAGLAELKLLAQQNDPIALREGKRDSEMKKAQKQLLVASTALRKDIKAKEKELSDELALTEDLRTMGFDELMELRREIDEKKERRAAILERKTEFDLYRNTAAERVEKIKRIPLDEAKGQGFVDDPMAALQLASKTWPLDALPSDHKILLLGGKDKEGKQQAGRLEKLRNNIDISAERISVDAKMFPSEPDLTDLTPKQHGILTGMLDQAKILAETDKLAECQALIIETEKLWHAMVGSNKFSTPAPEDAQPSLRKRVDKAVNDLTVAIDTLWAKGGDDNDVLRNKLTAIKTGMAAKGNARLPLSEAESRLGLLKAEVLLVEVPAPVLTTEETDARSAAAETHGKMQAALADLFKTKKLDETKIGDVPRDKLLVVNGTNGPEYYEIDTKHEGTVERRDDKHIPREVIQQLFQQASTLEVMLETAPPGSKETVEAANERAAVLLKNAMEGGPDYDYVAKQIKAVDQLVPKDPVEWIPAGLTDARIGYDNFKKTYVLQMTAKEARVAVDDFTKTFQQISVKQGDLKQEHDRVKLKLDALQTELKGSSGSSKASPAKMLAELVKKGPSKILSELGVSAPLGRDELKAWNEVQQQLTEDLRALAEVKKGEGFEGDLRNRLKAAYQSLGTKSATGIGNADKDADKIKTDLDDAVKAVTDAKPSDGKAYLDALSNFIHGARVGADTRIKAENEYAEVAKDAETQLKTADGILSKQKSTLKSYNEYKAVYDGLKVQMKTAETAYKGSDNPEKALSDMRLVQSSAAELVDELQNLNTITTKSDGSLAMTDWQKILADNIAKVGSAAESAAEAMLKKASEDPGQAAYIPLATTVANALKLAAGNSVKKLASFSPAVIREMDKAVAEQDPAARKKLFAVTRELALAEVRRIRKSTEDDPALKLYRDNPFDKGIGWAQFIVTLHLLEKKITTSLKP
ncbi:hypothetical protein GC209_01095 [bacterium]|nr:hypothetical protein [bacterium]